MKIGGGLMRQGLAVLALCVVATLYGCAEGGGEYGKAYQSWFAYQVADRAAPRDPSPAASLSPALAAGIRDHYVSDLRGSQQSESKTTKALSPTSTTGK
jgi:hypothetical protein